jgi:hypothetical protein
MHHSPDPLDEPQDVVVLSDVEQARAAMKALEKAGIRHVEFWPEHLLDPHPVLGRDTFSIAEAYGRTARGPFHIRVRTRDIAQANSVLSSTGLSGPFAMD